MRLKEKSSRLLVVIDMSSVRTDVTSGHDFITECGGVDLQYDANVLTTVISGHDRGVSAAFRATPAPAEEPPMHPQRHVSVSTKDNSDVTLKTDDGIVRWDAGGSFGVLSWVWKESGEHTTTISSGLGEYPRTKLSANQEELFAEEIQNWPDNG